MNLSNLYKYTSEHYYFNFAKDSLAESDIEIIKNIQEKCYKEKLVF